MPIPGASRRAEHVRPILDRASCDPPLKVDRPRRRVFRDVPWLFPFAGQHPRSDIAPPGPTPHSFDRVPPCSPRAPRPLGEYGTRSLGALLRNTREQCTNLSLPVAPVSPQRADRGQFAGLRPAGDGLGVDTEHRGDLSWRQQRLSLWCTCGHVRGLSSWTSAAILRLLVL